MTTSEVTVHDQVVDDGVQLKRELGLFAAVNMILGIIIGAGIFISSASALAHSGSVGMCLVVWVVSGIVSLLGALAYAELGTVIPRSGAEYAYYMEAFGPLHPFWGKLPAFLCSWLFVIAIYPAGAAVSILTFGEYICQPIFDTIGTISSRDQAIIRYAVAYTALGVITLINVKSVKLYVKVQNVFSFFKVTACLVIIGGGMYELCRGNFENLSKGFEGTNTSPRHIVLAFYSGLWAYTGWTATNTVTEEIKKPEVNILRSILISVPFVTLLYVLMNVSYMTVLTVPEIVNAPAVGVLFGERLLGPLQFIIPLGVALATFGCALSTQFSISRICFVAAQDGHMLECLSYIHKKDLTPVPALLLQSIITCLFMISGDVVQLIEFASFLIWIAYGTSMVALLIFRRTKKDVFRSFTVPTFVAVFVMFVALFLAIVPIVTDPTLKYLFAIIFILIGVLIYYWFIYKEKRPKFMDRVTHRIKVLCRSVPCTVNHK